MTTIDATVAQPDPAQADATLMNEGTKAQPVRQASTDKHWCETCDGIGTIDETLGGEHFSNPKAECPDCDGNGYWIRRSQPVQLAAVDAVEQDTERLDWLIQELWAPPWNGFWYASTSDYLVKSREAIDAAIASEGAL